MKQQVREVATLLASKAKEIDLGRDLSFGQNSVKNFVGEHLSNVMPGWKIRNTTAQDIVLVMVPGSSLLGELPADVAKILEKTKANAVFAKGEVFSATAPATGEVTISSTSTKYDLDMFLRYIAKSPIRFASWSLKSRTVANAPDNSNFENNIESVWFTPFGEPVRDHYSLRNLQNSYQQSTEFARVDFLNTSFNAILSDEHVLMIQVNAGTELVITAQVGAQDSRAQRFFRAVKTADTTLQPYRGE